MKMVKDNAKARTLYFGVSHAGQAEATSGLYNPHSEQIHVPFSTVGRFMPAFSKLKGSAFGTAIIDKGADEVGTELAAAVAAVDLEEKLPKVFEDGVIDGTPRKGLKIEGVSLTMSDGVGL